MLIVNIKYTSKKTYNFNHIPNFYNLAGTIVLEP